jgi:hypothetical protein
MKTFYKISPIFNPGGIGSGFFSNYRICLEKLIYFHSRKKEGIPYISWANTTFVDGFNPIFINNNLKEDSIVKNDKLNPFDFWFDQEIPENDTIVDSPIERPSSCWIEHSRDYFYERENLKLQQTVDKLYIKPKQYILDKIDEIYLNNFSGETVLGVMARGSEYNHWHGNIYGNLTIETYIAEIKKTLDLNKNITKLFLVSDETEYIERLSAEFPSSYFLPNIFRRTDESIEYINSIPYWMNISNKRENHCTLLGEETIIQTKLLSKCDYMIGRHCGILAGAVLWNENIKELIKIT